MDEMSKQGLYIWLKSVVNSGRCHGVTWIDEANGIFQIPWSNQKSRTWQKEDSSIFLEYAKHTSKYKLGDKMDFPKWKQNLKSAINKNRYIERLRVHDHLFGSRPYRVYRFLNEKTERKRSDDDLPDDIKIATVDLLSQSHISDIGIAGGLSVNNEVLSVNRSFLVSSDSESTNSRSSPLSSTAVQSSFPLSPDIPRSDVCDQLAGNIPTFVTTYCDSYSYHMIGDDSLSSSLPESISANTPVTTPSYTDILTGYEFNKQRDSSKKNAIEDLHFFLKTQGNDNQKLNSSKTLTISKMQEQMQSEIRADSMRANSHDTTQFTDLKQDSVYAKVRHNNNDWAGKANTQKFDYLVTFQQSASNSDKAPRLNFRCLVTDADLALPMVDLKDVSQDSSKGMKMQQTGQESKCRISSNKDTFMDHELPTTAIPEMENFLECSSDPPDCSNEPSMKMQQTGQESKCRISSSKDTFIDHEMPTTSIPELENFLECSSDPPSSMDTYDVNLPSDNNKSTGAQFTTHRGSQMPETSLKETLISPTTTSITTDSVMHVQVLYGTPHRTVKKFIVTSQRSSCRLFYGAVRTPFMQRAIQGQQDAEEVELPPVDAPDSAYYDEDKKIAIGKILKDMELGIVITYRNDDIFVERRCLPRVYLSDGVSKSESLPRSTQKRPDVKTLAFDYNKNFKESVELNKRNNNALPKDHFFLTIGYQILANDESPTRMVPVYIVVRHVKAALERFKILGASAIAPNPMCSDPNSFDKHVQLFKELDLK